MDFVLCYIDYFVGMFVSGYLCWWYCLWQMLGVVSMLVMVWLQWVVVLFFRVLKCSVGCLCGMGMYCVIGMFLGSMLINFLLVQMVGKLILVLWNWFVFISFESSLNGKLWWFIGCVVKSDQLGFSLMVQKLLNFSISVLFCLNGVLVICVGG